MEENHNGHGELITENIQAYLDINARIYVSPSFGENNGVMYDSRIDDFNENSLFIAVPTDNGIPVPFIKGAPITVCILTEKGRFSFKSNVSGIRKEGSFSLEISIPEKIYRLQLREFFRVSAYIKIKIYMLDMSSLIFAEKNKFNPEWVIGTLSDISGGGCMFSSPFNILEGQFIVIDFAESAIEDVGRVECSLIRCRVSGTLFTSSVNFIDISSAQRDKIVRYVFRRQIELRDLQ